jgi:hypothetical protein
VNENKRKIEETKENNMEFKKKKMNSFSVELIDKNGVNNQQTKNYDSKFEKNNSINNFKMNNNFNEKKKIYEEKPSKKMEIEKEIKSRISSGYRIDSDSLDRIESVYGFLDGTAIDCIGYVLTEESNFTLIPSIFSQRILGEDNAEETFYEKNGKQMVDSNELTCNGEGFGNSNLKYINKYFTNMNSNKLLIPICTKSHWLLVRIEGSVAKVYNSLPSNSELAVSQLINYLRKFINVSSV